MVREETPSELLYLNKFYLDNIPSTPPLSTTIGKYTDQKSTTEKLANTNHTGMEHFLLSAIAMGSE